MSLPVESLITRLTAAGIQLRVEAGGRLRYRAPKGALTPEFATEIKAYRADLIAHLQSTLSGEDESIVRLPDSPHFALSQAQWRLWILMQLQRDSTAYNVPLHLSFKGELDPHLVERVFTALISRHEALRTNFVTFDDQPRQVIRSASKLSIPFTDLSAESDPEASARALAHAQTSRPFDLARDALMRVALLRLNGSHHVLLLTLHHIIIDGTSCGILLRDFGQLYAAFAAGSDDPLPPLSLQYRDFAAWQNTRLHHPSLAPQGAYWRQKLGGEIPTLALPGDHSRPAVLSHRGAEVTFEIDESATAQFGQFCQQSGATLFMGLLAAVKLLLHRYTGQTDLIIGSPTAGRARPELEDQVGFYINTLALRTQLNPQGDAAELLREVRATVTAAFDHQEYPFDFLVNELDLQRDQSRSPLFDVMVTLQNQDESGTTIAGLLIDSFLEPSQTSKVDLTFYFKQVGTKLRGAIEYNTDIYAACRIERMVGHLSKLFNALPSSAGQPIAHIDLLNAAEREQLLREFNPRPPVDYVPDTLVARFDARVAAAPEATAITMPAGSTLTYSELNQRANQLAGCLVAAGVTGEDPVGLFLERSPDLIVAMVAILKAGGAYLPLDPIYPDDRISFLLKDAQAPVVLTSESLRGRLPSVGPEIIIVGADADQTEVPAVEIPRITPENAAYIIYTSGSTGTPKGCVIPHAQVVRLFDATQSWFGFSNRDVWSMFHSPAFDFSVWEIWGALLFGGRLVIVPHATSRDPHAFLDLLRHEQVTVLNQTPSAFQQFSLAEEIAGPSEIALALRTVIFGGEALEVSRLQGWWERHGDQVPQLINMYGITETTVHVTYRPLSKADLALGGRSVIGVPIPDLTVHLLDPAGELVPVGVPGEIHVGGQGLARGYLNRAELTAERFIPDPFSAAPHARLYRSGDLARWSPGGELEYLGRADQQVKIRGFRIELGEIEARLTEHAAVAQAHVFARTDAAADTQLVAYLTASDSTRPPTAEALRQHLAGTLPDYMIPAAFAVLTTLPLTANGKLDLKALPEPILGTRQNNPDVVVPRNDIERAWATIWREVLEVPELGVTDSFFDLGGHSLKAVRLVARARLELGSAVTIADIFSHPTIAELSRLQPTSAPSATAPADSSKESEPTLSIAQRRLWILEQMRPGTAAYNISNAWEIVGALDRDRLATALHALVERHATLRTTFVHQDDVVVPSIAPATEFSLEHLDVNAAPDPEAAATNTVGSLAAESFNLARGPLFRAICIRVSDRRHILVLTMHHIVSDGWSMELIIRELTAFYREPTATLPPTASYHDYAAVRTAEINGEVGSVWRNFWLKALSEDQEVLNLPTDFMRPKIMSATGRVAEICFDATTSAALKTLATAENSTVFMVFVALVKTLLYRYTNQTDLSIGTPVAGRDRVEWEHTVGFFINTIVLRDEVDPDRDFRALLRRVRQTSLAAFAHQNYPFDQLVDDLQVERDLSRHPIFDVSVQHAPRDNAIPELAGLSVIPLRHDQIPLKCDLSFDFGEDARGLNCGLTYNPTLFTSERIDRLGQHLLHLASAIVTAPDVPLAALPLLNERERAQVLQSFAHGPSQAPTEVSISQWFDDVVGQHGNQPALINADQLISYDQLKGQVDALARRLIDQGVQAGATVGVMMNRGFGLPTAMLAIMRLGAIYLPLDPVLPDARIKRLIEDGRVTRVITDEPTVARCPAGVETIKWETAESTNTPGLDAPYPQPSDPAYLIYTSGSTGEPKGVLVSHEAYANTALNQLAIIQLKPGDRLLQFANSSFDASVFEILGALLAGAGLVFAPPAARTDPEAMTRFLHAHQVTVAVLPPSFLRALNHADLPLRVLITAGESAIFEDVRHYASRLTYLNAYGPTEAAVCNSLAVITTHSLSDDSPNVPIGRPLPGTQLYLLDADLNPVPIGVDGELFIGGHGLASGYWRQPELTAQAFVPHPFSANPQERLYRTGDIGRWLPNGQVVFLGRRDGQIKLRGHRIETEEIAQVLQTHPAVNEALVILRRDRPDHPLLCAYIRPHEATATAEAMREFIAERLPSYMIPDAWVMLDTWPMTAAGKIDRRALPAPDLSVRGETYVAPRDEVERLIAAVFQEVLELEQVGVHDRFFRLGGNSLIALRAVTRIREALRVELPVTEFFAHASVAELGQVLRGSPEARQKVDKIAAARAKLAKMTPAQKEALLAAKRARAAAG
ncbi:MAG: amino acid adenylation domain-containing protein [bacterium]